MVLEPSVRVTVAEKVSPARVAETPLTVTCARLASLAVPLTWSSAWSLNEPSAGEVMVSDGGRVSSTSVWLTVVACPTRSVAARAIALGPSARAMPAAVKARHSPAGASRAAGMPLAVTDSASVLTCPARVTGVTPRTLPAAGESPLKAGAVRSMPKLRSDWASCPAASTASMRTVCSPSAE